MAGLACDALTESFARIRRHVVGARSGEDPEALHQLRVGIRRYRAAATLARRAGLDPLPEGVRDDVRWLWRMLGDVRDWDVLAEQTWPAAMRLWQPGAPSEDFDAQIVVARAASRRKLRRALDGRRFDRVMAALQAFASAERREVQSHDSGRSAKKLAARLLSRRANRVLRRDADIGRLSGDAQHALRIDVKKLRYLGEILTALYDGHADASYLKRVAAVQSTLGSLNDLASARGRLDALAETLDRRGSDAIVAIWQRYEKAEVASLRRQLVKHWNKFVRADPFWE